MWVVKFDCCCFFFYFFFRSLKDNTSSGSEDLDLALWVCVCLTRMNGEINLCKKQRNNGKDFSHISWGVFCFLQVNALGLFSSFQIRGFVCVIQENNNNMNRTKLIIIFLNSYFLFFFFFFLLKSFITGSYVHSVM